MDLKGLDYQYILSNGLAINSHLTGSPLRARASMIGQWHYMVYRRRTGHSRRDMSKKVWPGMEDVYPRTGGPGSVGTGP